MQKKGICFLFAFLSLFFDSPVSAFSDSGAISVVSGPVHNLDERTRIFVSQQNNEYVIRNNRFSCPELRISAIDPSVIRVRYSYAVRRSTLLAAGVIIPQSDERKNNSLVIKPDFAKARSRMQLNETRDYLSLATEQVRVKVNKVTLAIQFEDNHGHVVLEDDYVSPVTKVGTGFQITKRSPLDEHYFGLGDKSGPLDHRGQSYCFWNSDPPLWQESTDPMYKSIPFLLAMRNGSAYGIYLDNTYRSFFDLCKRQADRISFGAESGPIDYYFFYGPTPKNVLESFTGLVGRMPLPPMFSLGYQQSRGSYAPESAVKDVAAQLRERKIPCDVIYLDGDYKQDARPFTVDQVKFPDFPGLLKDLSSKGFKTVISMDPYIAKVPGDKKFEEGASKGYFLKKPDGNIFLGKVWAGECAFADFSRPEVRRWWGGLHSDFVRDGVRGIWDDMNEPALFGTPERTLPLNTVHGSGKDLREHRELHNVFALENTHATYDGLRSLQPNLRPFVLTRSGFAGGQRYAATWTGDNTSSWNHMRISVPQLLNLGLSGFCFAGSDIGGFNGFSGGPSPELLTRWMQLGAFNPLFRNHSDGVTRKREPWVDGPGHEGIRRKYIEERYRLLPYIYTCMEEASRTGAPLMRPLFLEFPKDKSVETNSEQYMFGPDILVAPKLWEIAGPYPVLLPTGEWFEFQNGKSHMSSESLNVNPELADLPLFVRAGAILPRQPLVQHTGEKPDGPLELRVYQGKNKTGSGRLYLDDGESMNYLKTDRQDYLKLDFRSEMIDDKLEIKVGPSNGGYAPWFENLQVVLVGIEKDPKTLTLDGNFLIGWRRSGHELILPAMPWKRSGQKIQVGF